MRSFITDPATGKMRLATRRRMGGGCHGAKNLHWKSKGGGVEALRCKICGKEHGQRTNCFRCEGLKEDFGCIECGQSSIGGEQEAGVSRACSGKGGLCCSCAGIDGII